MTPTRREALLGAAGLALTGCGVQREPGEDPGLPGTSDTGRRADAEVLNAALGTSLAALAAYGPGDALRSELRVVEQRHVARLSDAVTRLGGDPVREVVAPAAGRAPAALIAAEERSIAAARDLIPKLSDRDARSLLAAVMVEDAEQLGRLRDAEGSDPAPDAFLRPEVSA